MSYSYTLSMVIPASPVEIYEAWLDSVAHAEMTGGGEAVMSDEVGAEISALDGQITGRNLELVPPSASSNPGAQRNSTTKQKIRLSRFCCRRPKTVPS
jgi:hypothetical protein